MANPENVALTSNATIDGEEFQETLAHAMSLVLVDLPIVAVDHHVAITTETIRDATSNCVPSHSTSWVTLRALYCVLAINTSLVILQSQTAIAYQWLKPLALSTIGLALLLTLEVILRAFRRSPIDNRRLESILARHSPWYLSSFVFLACLAAWQAMDTHLPEGSASNVLVTLTVASGLSLVIHAMLRIEACTPEALASIRED